jgi:hypothetical protein
MTRVTGLIREPLHAQSKAFLFSILLLHCSINGYSYELIPRVQESLRARFIQKVVDKNA